MKKLRIVFMGTPDFAVSSLQTILDKKYKVVGVITAPDRPAGRGRKLQQSAVKKFASEKNLKILQPTNLKSPQFQEELKELNPNLQVVVAFRMLPKEVWQLPEYGTFNLHASLLPQYRGAAPINWAIINGEKATGVSTFFLDEKIDTGAIILQKKISINDKETVGQLHDRLMGIGAQLVAETLEKIEKGDLKTIAQTQVTNLNPAPKLDKANTKINWQLDLQTIYNHIRGLNPYPAAWTSIKNGSEKIALKIFDVDKVEKEHTIEIGKLKTEDHKLFIAVKNGFLEIHELQLPGKRKMKTRELLNGFQFEKEATAL